ncbi:MAG TPA: hypothetical protein PLS90_06820 [Candidatus Sumerlaeota bacterium]|nr:hypothetical protein [Candidatus Sumerlaeota bacterium]
MSDRKPFELDDTGHSLRPIGEDSGKIRPVGGGGPAEPAAPATAPAPPGAAAPAPSRAGAPARTERTRVPARRDSLIVLALLLLAAIGAWLMYGPYIRMLFARLFGAAE